MNIIFINSKNNKTSDPHRLLLHLTDKINLNTSDKSVAYQTLAFTIHRKYEKCIYIILVLYNYICIYLYYLY